MSPLTFFLFFDKYINKEITKKKKIYIYIYIGLGTRWKPLHAAQSCLRVGACGGRTKKRLMAKQSEGSPNHGGVTHVAVRLPEVYRSYFEKNQIQGLQEGGGSEVENGM